MHTRVRSLQLYVVAPMLVFTVLQTSGCTRRPEPPPPPGGTYISTSAGAHFDQSVALATDEGATSGTIASFSLGSGFRPPHSPQEIYIAAAERGYVWSKDGGATWLQVTPPLKYIGNIILLENGTLVAAGLDAENQGLVIRSNDGGLSWESTLTIPIDLPSGGLLGGGSSAVPTRVISIEIDPFDPNRVYAGSNLGSIFVGEQSAKVWRTEHALRGELFTSSRAQVGAVEIMPSPHVQGELLIITSAHRLIRINADGTQEEIKISKELTAPSPFGAGELKKVHDVAYIADFPDALFVAVEDGAVISRDRGATFEQLPIPIDQFKEFNTSAIAASPTNPARLLVGINNVVYRSEDGGKTWSTFPLATAQHGIVSVLIDPTNASRVLVVTTRIDT